MALPLALSQQLVRVLDKAFNHGLRPGRDERAVCAEAIRRVAQGRDAYLAYISTQNQAPHDDENDDDDEEKKKAPSTADDNDNEDGDGDGDDDEDEGPSTTDNEDSVPGTQRDAPSASILPDGWEAELAAWFDGLRKRGKNQNLALAFAREIDATIRSHPAKACATYQPSSQTVAAVPTRARIPLSKAHTGGAKPPSRPLLPALTIPNGPSAAGPTAPPTASTPALSAGSHLFSTPEGLSPATPDSAAPLPLPNEGVCDLGADEEAGSPTASSPGPVYGPYSPAPPSPRRHSTPERFASAADSFDLAALFAGGLLVDATDASPFLDSTPALSAPSSARVDSPPEHFGSQLATPDAQVGALALWGIVPQPPNLALDPTEEDDACIRPSSRTSSSPASEWSLSSSRNASPTRSSSPPTSVRALATRPETPASVLIKVAARVAAHFDNFNDVLALSHACQGTRAAVIAEPEVWTDVQVRSTKEHAVFWSLLVRSEGAQRPLRIAVLVTFLSHFSGVIGALSAVVGRTAHLAVALSKPQIVGGRILDRLVASPAPLLESLELRFRTEDRPASFFGGIHRVTTLTCQLWQLQKVDPSHLASVAEFVALAPPPSVGQYGHSASVVFWQLQNLGHLVLDHAFREKNHMPAEYYPPERRELKGLVLDQRTGPRNWDPVLTAATLRRLCVKEIESVLLVAPLVDAAAAALVWEGLDKRPPEEFALLPLDGELHVGVLYRHPRRGRFLLAAPEPVLRTFQFTFDFLLERLTLAQHMPLAALRYLASTHLRNLKTLTIWLNRPGDGLHSLLEQDRGMCFKIDTSLSAIRLVAAFPPMPDVCHGYLGERQTCAPCTLAAADLSRFFRTHGWLTALVALRLEEGVTLVGSPLAHARLLRQVKSITRIK